MMKTPSTGRVWLFGDDVANDGQIMDMEMTRQIVYEPARLAPLAMCGIDPTFASRVAAGDVVVAGRNFGHGPMHVQGPIALAAHGVVVVCESMARSFYRLSVAVGLKALPFVPGITGFVAPGDRVAVDLVAGRIVNLTQGTSMDCDRLSGPVLEILEAGGEQAWLRDQALVRSDASLH